MKIQDNRGARREKCPCLLIRTFIGNGGKRGNKKKNNNKNSKKKNNIRRYSIIIITARRIRSSPREQLVHKRKYESKLKLRNGCKSHNDIR